MGLNPPSGSCTIIPMKEVTDKKEEQRIDNKFFNHKKYDYSYIFDRYNVCGKDKRVLDVGCGVGQNLRYFSPKSVGITYADDNSLAYVKKRYGLNFRKFNIDETWPNDLGMFDTVFSADSIIHFLSPFKMLLEARRFLKDDGTLIIMIPQSSLLFKEDEFIGHWYTFNKKTLTHSIEHAGFTVIKYFGYIRSLPKWLNTLLNPLTSRFGPYLWVVAKKNLEYNIAEAHIPPYWLDPKCLQTN